MFLSYSSEKEDAEDKDIGTVPAPTQPSMPQTDGASVDSIPASTIASESEPGPEGQVTGLQEGGDEEKEGGAVTPAEPACEAENHLWATVEEKPGNGSSEEKAGEQQEEEGGVAGG